MVGGVAVDLADDGVAVLQALIAALRRRFSALVTLYDDTDSLQDRTVGTGVLQPALARRFGAGGHVGRTSGRAFDARRTPGYPPYDSLRFEVPVLAAGDVDARVWIRIREVEQSLCRRLPALQQVVQLLLFGPRSVEACMRKLLFQSLIRPP